MFMWIFGGPMGPVYACKRCNRYTDNSKKCNHCGSTMVYEVTDLD